MNDDVFDKYYKRVAKRARVKSLFIGLIVGFFTMLVAAMIVFFTEKYSLFYIPIIVFVVCSCVTAPLMYVFRYRPTMKEVANAVDSLGMEERFVTMLELEGSNSYIAKRQRADTYSSAQSVPASAIRIAVSTALIVLLIVAGALGLFATTYVGLADAGIAPGLDEVIEGLTSEEEYTYYTVEYEDASGTEDEVVYWLEQYGLTSDDVGDGVVNGEWLQLVMEGENCTTVYAEALDDSVFVCWSDGYEEPERTDKNIQEDMTIYAIFAIAEEGDGGGEGDSSDGDSEGDSDSDSSAMGEDSAEQDAGDGESGEGDSSDSSSQGQDDSDDSQQGSGAGGGTNMNNNVYENETDYGNEIGSATDDAGQKVSSGDYSDTEESIVGGYFGRLNP